MGVLANHVPSIEQLKPGLVEVMEESGASQKFFRMSDNSHLTFEYFEVVSVNALKAKRELTRRVATL